VSHADARNRVYASRGPLTADAELWALPHQQRSLIGMRVSPDRRTVYGHVLTKVLSSGGR